MADLNDSDGVPFLTDVTDINAQVAIGLLAESPAVLIKTDMGGQFIRLTVPEAKTLYEQVKRLAQ